MPPGFTTDCTDFTDYKYTTIYLCNIWFNVDPDTHLCESVSSVVKILLSYPGTFSSDPRFFAFLYSMCGDPQLAEDLTQDVFVRALRALERYRPQGKMSTWLSSGSTPRD